MSSLVSSLSDTVKLSLAEAFSTPQPKAISVIPDDNNPLFNNLLFIDVDDVLSSSVVCDRLSLHPYNRSFHVCVS